MQPYPGVDISNVYEQLENNKRLDRPDNCPRDYYALMKSCWAWDENERSNFHQLFQSLNHLHDRMMKELQMKSAYQVKDVILTMMGHTGTDCPSFVT